MQKSIDANSCPWTYLWHPWSGTWNLLWLMNRLNTDTCLMDVLGSCVLNQGGRLGSTSGTAHPEALDAASCHPDLLLPKALSWLWSYCPPWSFRVLDQNFQRWKEKLWHWSFCNNSRWPSSTPEAVILPAIKLHLCLLLKQSVRQGSDLKKIIPIKRVPSEFLVLYSLSLQPL